MIDPMSDGTPVLPAAFEGHEISTVESRASYRKEKDAVVDGDIEEVNRLEQEPAAPEGPTTGKYEEWAYVSCSSSRAEFQLTVSTCTIMVIPVSGRTDTRQPSFRASSLKQDAIR
jgi:hypothetical protein